MKKYIVWSVLLFMVFSLSYSMQEKRSITDLSPDIIKEEIVPSIIAEATNMKQAYADVIHFLSTKKAWYSLLSNEDFMKKVINRLYDKLPSLPEPYIKSSGQIDDSLKKFVPDLDAGISLAMQYSYAKTRLEKWLGMSNPDTLSERGRELIKAYFFMDNYKPIKDALKKAMFLTTIDKELVNTQFDLESGSFSLLQKSVIDGDLNALNYFLSLDPNQEIKNRALTRAVYSKLPNKLDMIKSLLEHGAEFYHQKAGTLKDYASIVNFINYIETHP